MSKYSIQAIVLAAGKSRRFNTGNSKLLEKICGQEIILYSAKLLQNLAIPTHFVVGYQAEMVQECIKKSCDPLMPFILQSEQKGTGDALLQTKKSWTHDHILVMNGDMPLVTPVIITQLIQEHLQENASLSFVTAHHPQPGATDYGRVIQENNVFQIIEAKDIKNEHHESCCINAGIYLFKKEFLERNLEALTNTNAAREFYITDLVKIAGDQGLPIKTISESFDLIRGINTLKELWIAEDIKRSELISFWMERGVRFDVVQSIHIDTNVIIGAGTSVGAGTNLFNHTVIGQNCHIGPFCVIENTTIGNDVIIKSHSVLNNALIEQNAKIGPFAHINDQSIVKEFAQVGNFVETKRSTIGKNSKAKHLSYLGDTMIGENTNIGAGTITCNYDGEKKRAIVIEDNVFIGSNNTLVAPIIIEKGSYTAAGSTITKVVPQNSLAIGRARQINKKNYVEKIHKTKKNDLFAPTSNTKNTALENT